MEGPRAKFLRPKAAGGYEEETEAIRERSKSPEAQKAHKFQASEWTLPNGHPRCRVCGDEEPEGGECSGATARKTASSITLHGFHGTDAAVTGHLQPSESGTLGAGIYFTNTRESAAAYGSTILEADIHLQNPWVIRLDLDSPTIQELDWDNPAVDAVLSLPNGKSLVDSAIAGNAFGFGRDLTTTLTEAGYDGIVGTYTDGSKEIVAFRPEQVSLVRKTSKFLRPKTVTAAEEYSDEDLRTDWLAILDEIQWDIPAALVERITKLNNLRFEWKLNKRFLVLNDKVWLLFDPGKKTLEYISDIRRWANEIDSSELEDIVPDVAELYNPMVGESLNQLRASKSGEVYHYTSPEALEKIKASGFLTGSYGTGLTNRWAHGVFTSCDPETNADGAYGDVRITIDLGAILRDHPDVPLSWEPEIDECLMRDYLEGALGLEDGMGNNPDPSGGMAYDTLIIGAKIPLKYLSVDGESLAQPGSRVAAFEVAGRRVVGEHPLARARRMSPDEYKADWLDRHKGIYHITDRSITLYHATSSALAPGILQDGIRAGSYFSADPQTSVHQACRDRGLAPSQVTCFKVDLPLEDLIPGIWPSNKTVVAPSLLREALAPKTSKSLTPKVSPVLASLAQVAWA